MHKDEQAEPGAWDGVAIRNVSESTYPGRPAVIVRTTRLPGPDPDRERRVRAGIRRTAREGGTVGLTG